METSKLGKARAGVFLLLIAISLYSLFMISASNTSYAAGQSLFKFSSLIGLSPSANIYDRQSFVNSVSENLITSVKNAQIPSSKKFAVALLDSSEVASFLSSPRKSSFRRIVAAGSSLDKKDTRLAAGLLLLPFNSSSASIDTGLISQCIGSIPEDLNTGERDVDAVIACIFNGGNGVLAAASTGNPVDPFDNNNPGGTGVSTAAPTTTAAAPTTTAAVPTTTAAVPTTTAAVPTTTAAVPTTTAAVPTTTAAVPEPSTYMLLGLGMITLFGFSRKKAKARIS